MRGVRMTETATVGDSSSGMANRSYLSFSLHGLDGSACISPRVQERARIAILIYYLPSRIAYTCTEISYTEILYTDVDT